MENLELNYQKLEAYLENGERWWVCDKSKIELLFGIKYKKTKHLSQKKNFRFEDLTSKNLP